MTQTPNTFLHQPGPAFPLIPNQDTADLLTEAEHALRNTFTTTTPSTVRNQLLKQEAANSSAIEDEFAGKDIRFHHAALLRFTREPLTQESLLYAHSTIMKGKAHAQPGQYRTIDVQVAEYIPPHWESVPAYMEECLSFAQTEGVNPIVHAAWAHIQFEAIHPFADGNGRTGRAFIPKLLKAPIPLSEYILSNRQEYYRLLAQAEWEPYLNWFAQGIIRQCKDFQPA